MQATQPVPPGGLSVGATIRVLRESRDLSAAELGRLIGKSEPMVTAIERGERRATPAICLAVATALDVPLATIVGDQLAAILDPQPETAPR